MFSKKQKQIYLFLLALLTQTPQLKQNYNEKAQELHSGLKLNGKQPEDPTPKHWFATPSSMGGRVPESREALGAAENPKVEETTLAPHKH